MRTADIDADYSGFHTCQNSAKPTLIIAIRDLKFNAVQFDVTFLPLFSISLVKLTSIPALNTVTHTAFCSYSHS